MAYRRRHGISRASTFKEEVHQPSSDSGENAANPSHSHPHHRHHHSALPSFYSFSPNLSSSSSLAAQAIKASAARRDPSLSFTFAHSSFAPDHQRSKSFDAYGEALGRGDAKSGFWGVLAEKAKEILEDDNSSSQHDIIPERLRSYSFNTFTTGAQEGRTIVESKTARTQSKLKGSFPEDSNQASGMRNPWQQLTQTHSQTSHETQLKASRDVAMATAAKAKLLLRELKTVKADLAFAKARCAQLEEENKLIRDKEGRDKGENRADDDLIRLQLETLLTEKARLANENEIYSRENRVLREIVEYHQLTMQDVVYLDEGMEEVTELYPMDTSGVPSTLSSISPHSSSPPSPEILPFESRAKQTKETFPGPHEDKSISEDEAPPSISVSEDEHAK